MPPTYNCSPYNNCRFCVFSSSALFLLSVFSLLSLPPFISLFFSRQYAAHLFYSHFHFHFFCFSRGRLNGCGRACAGSCGIMRCLHFLCVAQPFITYAYISICVVFFSNHPRFSIYYMFYFLSSGKQIGCKAEPGCGILYGGRSRGKGSAFYKDYDTLKQEILRSLIGINKCRSI